MILSQSKQHHQQFFLVWRSLEHIFWGGNWEPRALPTSSTSYLFLAARGKMGAGTGRRKRQRTRPEDNAKGTLKTGRAIVSASSQSAVAAAPVRTDLVLGSSVLAETRKDTKRVTVYFSDGLELTSHVAWRLDGGVFFYDPLSKQTTEEMCNSLLAMLLFRPSITARDLPTNGEHARLRA